MTELTPLDKLQIIKMQLRNAEITHPEARLLAKPLIIEVNNRVKEIAKKYNRKPRLFTFENLIMR